MQIPSYLVGSGNASQAMRTALEIATRLEKVVVAEPIALARGERLPVQEGPSLLFLATPHALHAPLMLEGQAAGFTHIVTEKPAAVSLEQVRQLSDIHATVAVCHGYRQNWGPQTLRQKVASGELGTLISVEGRYWQSSAAEQVLTGKARPDAWKNHPAISGPFDTYLDLGTHWADLVSFVVGAMPDSAKAWLSYGNSEAAHRDTHVHLELGFAGGVRSFGSISKTVHGMGNYLELVIVGTKATASWNFERPDELTMGRGKERSTLMRSPSEATASGMPPNHGLGWLEGYVSIVRQMVRSLAGKPTDRYPTLAESLTLVERLLTIERSV